MVLFSLFYLFNGISTAYIAKSGGDVEYADCITASLQRGKTLHLANVYPGFDAKPSDSEASALEL